MAKVVNKDEIQILNYCAKYISRTNTAPIHNFGHFDNNDFRSQICESWRFPIIEAYYDGINLESSYQFNEVTFVYVNKENDRPLRVSVIGTFENLYDGIPMNQISDTMFYTVTVVVPKGQVHFYKYVIDNKSIPDPINPQHIKLDNGKEWSRFFTDLCTIPIVFGQWELKLLNRLVDYILPFRTREGERFLKNFYFNLDNRAKESDYMMYQLDESIGVTNYIDKLLAKEESHHINDYKICLQLISDVLRHRKPDSQPWVLSDEIYENLYYDMVKNSVENWDYTKYGNSNYFVKLLRRHTFTGSFTHPKYCGNISTIGWNYLEERYKDDNNDTLFNWRKSIEKPIGISERYRG